MIKKIISGGLTVSDQAVLDVSISLGIPHSGYIPWGRMTEIGTLPSKYKLHELNTDDHFDCIERNVKESKGTLIISSGKPNDDSDYARRMTLKHGRQLLGIDLNSTTFSKAASLVNDWIQVYKIDVMYVIGPFTYEYPKADSHITAIVEGALLLDISNAPSGSNIADLSIDDYFHKLPDLPKTVDDAVDHIISDMTLDERVRMANLNKEELRVITYSLSTFIRNQLFRKGENKSLFESCRSVSDNKNLNESEAALVIIEKLWEKLRRKHRLRIVK